MPSTTTIDRTPFYAAAGMAEVAVVTLRDLPGRVSNAVSDEKLRAEFRGRLAELPTHVRGFRDGFPDRVLQSPGRASELPDMARDVATKASRDAAKTYRELAARGELAVERLRDEYGPAVRNAVTTFRGRVADAADDIADATRKVADDIASKR